MTWVKSSFATRWTRLSDEWIYTRWPGVAHLCCGTGLRFAAQAVPRGDRLVCTICSTALPEHLQFVVRVSMMDPSGWYGTGFYDPAPQEGGVFYHASSRTSYQEAGQHDRGFWDW